MPILRTADFSSARSIARGWRHVESGKWGERKGLGFGVDLAGKTLGIVGLGDIGSAVVPRAQAVKKVIYHNRHRRAVKQRWASVMLDLTICCKRRILFW